MLSNAIVQVGLFSVLVTVLSVPLASTWRGSSRSERTFLDPVLQAARAHYLPALRRASRHRDDLVEYAVAMLLFSLVGMLLLYGMERLQEFLPLNPQGFGAQCAGPLLQYRGQLHHQHQLAGLCGRVHHELSDPDGGAGVSQLRFRRGGYRRWQSR